MHAAEQANRFGISEELYQALKLSPVKETAFMEEFAPDVDRLINWLGPLAEHRDGGPSQGVALNHIQAATRLAGNAMLLAQESSYRAWTPQGRLASKSWAQVIWRRALVNNLGNLIARRAIMRHGSYGSWDPLKEDLPLFLSGAQLQIKPSNRPINPEQMEQAIYTYLYGNLSAEFSMMTLALVDSFSVLPNADNPIAQTVQWGEKRMMSQGQWVLPWWWGQRQPLDLVTANEGQTIKQGATPELSDINEKEVAQEAVRFMIEMAEIGRATVNEKGAWFHQVDDTLYMVVPLVLEQVAAETPPELGGPISPDQARRALYASRVLPDIPDNEDRCSVLLIQPGGPEDRVVGKIKAIALQKDIGKLIAPDATNNPDIHLE